MWTLLITVVIGTAHVGFHEVALPTQAACDAARSAYLEQDLRGATSVSAICINTGAVNELRR